MRGSSKLELEVTEPGEDSLVVLLNRGLTVKAIRDGSGHPVRFSREADAISIPQQRLLRSGERRKYAIEFSGTFFNESREQGYSQMSIAPAGSFASWVTEWYPMVQGSGSKSPGRIAFDVPEGVTVASSGRLTETRSVKGRSQQVFSVDRPLNFSFAAARYFHGEKTVGPVRLGIYLLRGGEAKAELYLREATRILEIEQSLWGPYPFDGYAVVEIPSDVTGGLGGSSEQGMNLFPVGVLPEAGFPLLLVAHEMGHSWWGNLVGSTGGAIVDEGLAQTSAVLCLLELQGEKAMRNFLKNGVPGYSQSATQYFLRFAGPGGKDYPLNATAQGSDAAGAMHDIADTKGMFVYEMLRERLGSAAFVGGLRSIVERFAGKKVSLGDLRTAWERTSGQDLSQFWHQWMDRTGAPDLTLEWTARSQGRGFLVSGTISQQGAPYDVTAEVALAYPGRHDTKTVAVSGPSTPFAFTTEQKPRWVVLDPDYKILRWTPAFRNARLLADGIGLTSMGRSEEAVARLSDNVGKVPESLEGRYQLGVAAQDAGKLGDAERAFREVLDRHASLGVYEPAVTQSAVHLGQVLDLTGHRDEALAAYRRALELPAQGAAHEEARAGLTTAFKRKERPPPPSRDLLARFTGTYDGGQGIALHVGLDDSGVLTVSQAGKPTLPLLWVEGSKFRVPGANSIALEFKGGTEGSSVDVDASGLLLHLPKTK
ncbi:MAG TPA: M1 family aminopeptidase [Myxococcaceae bacterium]|nr:M1 family aminopeptidase [Myxococcaceae bacterium]